MTPPPFDESQMNALIDELSAARSEELAAIAEAKALTAQARMPYDEGRLKAFCDAGERMLAAQKRKLNAWNDLRAAEAQSVDTTPVIQPAPRRNPAVSR